MNPERFKYANYRRRSVDSIYEIELGLGDMIAGLGSCFSTSALDALRDRLGDLLGEHEIIFAPSARHGLAQLLALLPQKEVVLPAYTCSVVCEAALVAGKKVIFADLAPDSVNARAKQFEPHARPGRILIPIHQFGIPTDIEEICRLAHERDCATIEDCAACFLGSSNGRILGTHGDAAIFSFEKSKRIPAFRGGAIVINNNKLIDAPRLAGIRFKSTRMHFPLKDALRCLAMKVAAIPWIYGRATLPYLLNLPGAGKETPPALTTVSDILGTAAYSDEFHPYQAALVLKMLDRLKHIEQNVSRSIMAFNEILADSSLVTYAPRNPAEGSLIRYPFSSRKHTRQEFYWRAIHAGADIGFGYTRLCCPLGDYDRFPCAARVVREMMFLPLNSRSSPEKARVLAEKIKLLDA